MYAKNLWGDPRWVPSQVIEVTVPCSYRVELGDSCIWRQHIDQLRHRRFPTLESTLGVACPEVPLTIKAQTQDETKDWGFQAEADPVEDLLHVPPSSSPNYHPLELMAQSPGVPEAPTKDLPNPATFTDLRR